MTRSMTNTGSSGRFFGRPVVCPRVWRVSPTGLEAIGRSLPVGWET
jgi:hypothetical protein